jgi:hypothetical protein
MQWKFKTRSVQKFQMKASPADYSEGPDGIEFMKFDTIMDYMATFEFFRRW